MYRQFLSWFVGRVKSFWRESNWPTRVVCVLLLPVLIVALCAAVTHCAGVTP